MSAAGWSYSVAYQPDVAAALRQLRQDVYDRGAYHREEPDPTYALTEDEFRATLDPAYDSGINDSLLDDWRAAQRRPDRSTRARCSPRNRTRVRTPSSTWSTADRGGQFLATGRVAIQPPAGRAVTGNACRAFWRRSAC
ncbi:hypothetical protein ABT214_02975 [Micromonospora purpureochromogenes]|uniref:hypothetical protein n=1 Tax=Micromonospora purpureochromogenes TaxID=47872 RepID=UPI0033340730